MASTRKLPHLLSLLYGSDVLTVNSYKCDSKINVLSCVSSGVCSFLEHCSTQCFADRQGAGCTGSATVAVEASEKREIDTEVHAEDEMTYECSNGK